jgi:hypothetical protein
MIPTHLLTDLTPNDRIAILSRGGEIHFLKHSDSATPEAIKTYAVTDGSRVLTSHMSDPVKIRAYVASREQDVGGEA